MKKPEKVNLNQEEVDLLMSRLTTCSLDDSDKTLIKGIIQFYLWLQWALTETKMSLHRLRSLFGFVKTEKRDLLAQPEDSEFTSDLELKQVEKSEKTIKGHGRLSHTAYSGATTIEQQHESLKSGELCPKKCGGKLYTIKPRSMICLKGHALASATRYLLERLRCSLCGHVFTARPPGISLQKYDPSLKAHLAIAKNYAGLPFYRLQMLQSMVGVPLSASTQWELVEFLADDIYPIYYALERLAAQGQVIHHDDTVIRILSLVEENKTRSGKDRCGMYTTGILSRVDARSIYLFISSRFHSGENMTKLLGQRSPGLAPFIRMADAASCNLSVAFEEILSLCLAHGRRKFYEIYDYFPGECRIVIDVLALVYNNDAIAKKEGMAAAQRLVYHQTQSTPALKTLKEWMTIQIEEAYIEPNSSLGKAFRYMLKHWDGLTRFLEVEGAPLDNNIIEMSLKIPIRSRKNSLFYKTEHGAFVGGMLTSIIHTCVMAK